MADITGFISKSRDSGYSDDEIRQALRQGKWKDTDIDTALTHPDTFMGESGLAGLGAIGDQLANSGHTINPQDIWSIIKNAYHGQAAETSSEQQRALEGLKQGGATGIEAAVRHGVGSIPLVGHPIAHGIQNLQQGNLGGFAGDLLSLLGPKAVSDAVEPAATGMRDAGLQLYRRNLPFDSASSPTDIENAVRAGVDQSLPAQGLFSKGTNRTLDRIGRTDQPGTVMGNLESETLPHVTGPAGSRKVNMETALSPFLKEIKGRLEAPTATGQNMAYSMLTEAEPALKKADPGTMAQIFDPNALGKGQPFSTEQRVGLIERWSQGNHNGLDVSDAHIGKRGMYNTLSDSMFRDNAGQVPPGAKATNMALSRGYKNAINEVAPEMRTINDRMHNTITLTDALNEAAKASPKEFSMLTNLAVGGAAGSAALMRGGGVVESAGAGLMGALALQAMKSPTVATRMAILMGKRFPQVAAAIQPYVLPMGLSGAAATQAVRPSGDESLQQLFQPKPQ